MKCGYVGLILITLILSGCGGGMLGDGSKEQPPTTQSDLYFIESQNGSSWNMGLPGFMYGRSDAIWLGTSPGFGYWQNHKGGQGNILEVVSFSNGMNLLWMFGYLNGIELFKGWQGQVITNGDRPTGLRIGSRGSDFLATFPEAKASQPNYYGGTSYCEFFTLKQSDYIMEYRLVADCDQNDTIRGFSVYATSYRLNEQPSEFRYYSRPSPFDLVTWP